MTCFLPPGGARRPLLNNYITYECRKKCTTVFHTALIASIITFAVYTSDWDRNQLSVKYSIFLWLIIFAIYHICYEKQRWPSGNLFCWGNKEWIYFICLCGVLICIRLNITFFVGNRLYASHSVCTYMWIWSKCMF